MDKKIIPSILLISLLLIPMLAMAQSSGNVNLEEEVAVISVPSWLKGTLFTWNAEGKYKITGANTGQLEIKPRLVAYIYKKDIVCPTVDKQQLGTWLTANEGNIDNEWQIKWSNDGTVFSNYRAGSNTVEFPNLGLIAPTGSVISYATLKSPTAGIMGDRCFLVRFVDLNTGAIMDYKTDTITVTTPEGKITLEWLGLTVIGVSAILISKGVRLW